MHAAIAKFIDEGVGEVPLEYARQKQLEAMVYHDETFDDVSTPDEEEYVQEEVKPKLFKDPNMDPRDTRKPTVTEAVKALDQVLEASPITPVVVRTTMATIKLPARLVSSSEYSIGFFLPVDSSAEFQIGAEFNIEVGGKVIPVMYAGGVFQLQRSAYLFMAFVVIKKEVQNV
jgi:hypothetical protein